MWTPKNRSLTFHLRCFKFSRYLQEVHDFDLSAPWWWKSAKFSGAIWDMWDGCIESEPHCRVLAFKLYRFWGCCARSRPGKAGGSTATSALDFYSFYCWAARCEALGKPIENVLQDVYDIYIYVYMIENCHCCIWLWNISKHWGTLCSSVKLRGFTLKSTRLTSPSWSWTYIHCRSEVLSMSCMDLIAQLSQLSSFPSPEMGSASQSVSECKLKQCKQNWWDVCCNPAFCSS